MKLNPDTANTRFIISGTLYEKLQVTEALAMSQMIRRQKSLRGILNENHFMLVIVEVRA